MMRLMERSFCAPSIAPIDLPRPRSISLAHRGQRASRAKAFKGSLDVHYANTALSIGAGHDRYLICRVAHGRSEEAHMPGLVAGSSEGGAPGG